MPPSSRQIVYVDTDVVIEAIDTSCWVALLNRFDVRTVTEVRREAQAGNRRIKNYVEVDADLFDEKVTVSEVTDIEIAAAQLGAPLMAQIDAGERDLLAYVAARNQDALLISTGDRAAIRSSRLCARVFRWFTFIGGTRSGERTKTQSSRNGILDRFNLT